MAKLISIHIVKNEAHCISNMLDSIQPYINENFIMIDDSTTDDTEEICRSKGCYVNFFHFENFAKTNNTLLNWVKDKSDWVFRLDADETLTSDFCQNLINFIPKIHNTDIDGVWFCRRHWEDLDKNIEFLGPKYDGRLWYPDWQLRLFRNVYPKIHYIKYVHEAVVGLRKDYRVHEDIHHFNMYWKTKMSYNFDKMNKLYNSLMELEKKENGKNIWSEVISD